MEATILELMKDAREIEQARTFGHLAPKPDTYCGWILFTLTAFGDTCIIDFEFQELSESPWLNSAVIEYIADYTDSLPASKHYGVFRFEGSYQKTEDLMHFFHGEITEINCTNQTL